MTDASQVRYRWVGGHDATPEDWDAIEMRLAARGWVALDRDTSYVLVAEDDAGLVGFACLRLVPHSEPLYVERRAYGTGVAETLADKVVEMLVELKVYGCMVVAESPFAAKLCEDRGYKRVESPVYVRVGG